MASDKRIPGLIEEQPLLVYPSLAARAGVNKAIILQQLHFLLMITEKTGNKQQAINGSWWVYNTYEDWKENYFPWLAVSTIKRLFISLEKEGVIISMNNPHAPTDQTKWYTLDRETFDVWKDTPYRNDTGISDGPVSKRDGGAYQKETGPVSKSSDDLYTENTAEITESETTENTTAAIVSSEPAREGEPPTPPAAAAVAEIIHSDFFETALKGFSLDGPLAAQLRARSELDGLALMLQATKGAKTSAPGLLMSLLRAEVSPNAESLCLAPLALELETLNWSELEQTARHREFEEAQAATWAIYQDKEATEPNAGESVGAVEDEPVDRNVEQARRVWSIAKGQLSIQLNRTTYDAWVARVEAQSYADNVLTLHAPNAYARDFLVKRMLDTLEHNARVAVGLDDLRVEVVA